MLDLLLEFCGVVTEHGDLLVVLLEFAQLVSKCFFLCPVLLNEVSFVLAVHVQLEQSHELAFE